MELYGNDWAAYAEDGLGHAMRVSPERFADEEERDEADLGQWLSEHPGRCCWCGESGFPCACRRANDAGDALDMPPSDEGSLAGVQYPF